MAHASTGNRPIGSAVERIEDLRFLRGRGEFVDDVPRAGALHAAILRSPIAHGRVRAIDTSDALARKGVRAVITAAVIGDVPIITMRQELLAEFKPYQQPVIARDKVRYVGEPVAVVVADSAALAEDVLETIALDIEPLPAVADRATARANQSVLFEETGRNEVLTLTALRGDADTAFRDAPYVRRERFSVQRFSAVPMEPRGLLAEWDAAQGHLTVSGAAKVAFHNRRILAKQMGLAEHAITMIEADVGGVLLMNEIAPRVHNSGHWSIEGARTSQFENHMRAVLGWPLGETDAIGYSAMVNCIGTLPSAEAICAVPGAHFHDYGKAPRPARKLGHVTVTAPDPDTLETRLAAVRDLVKDDG